MKDAPSQVSFERSHRRPQRAGKPAGFTDFAAVPAGRVFAGAGYLRDGIDNP
jgi:hypothetical protein